MTASSPASAARAARGLGSTVSTPRRLAAADAPLRRARLTGAVKGEWVKLRSVRSTGITVAAAGLLTVALGVVFTATAESGVDAPPAAANLTDPVQLALGGVDLTAMVLGVLGVLLVAGEYSTGLVRTTFAATGSRAAVLGAKAIVLAATTAAATGLSVVLALWLGQAVYAGDEPTLALTDPDAIGVMVGTTVFVTGVALIGLALGAILRSTASGIAVLVGGVFILPGLMSLLPDAFTDVVLKYLPSEAGSVMMSTVSDPDLLSSAEAYTVFAAWVGGLLVVAMLLTRTRDA